ncbi:MAG: DUF255 domain-containing protein [Kofleriaceae bacterium]
MKLPSLSLTLSLGLLASSCSCQGTAARTPPVAPSAAAAPTPARGAPRGELAWAEFSAETFARAKAERRFIVLDGSAEWCHWCHVMEAESYHDPRVQAILAASFIAVKVDVDSRPDLEERYGDYGWPATVIFSPDGEELGKYRGFIEPERFAEMLAAVVDGQAASVAPQPATAPEVSRAPLSEDHLAWIQRAVELELAEYWDEAQGGWGRRQKSPIGSNNAWLLERAAAGDQTARQQALFALDQQAHLLDPVWGGIYQYSTGGVWTEPHFEKLMTYQAPALENYARAFELTRDPKQLERARAMYRFLERFFRGPGGGFFGTQDADLHAHEPQKPFRTGHDYYALDERARLALGVPRVDPHEYARDAGLAIAAYATYYQVSGEASALAAAQDAAARTWESHRDPRGGLTHDIRKVGSARPELRYLSDNAAFGGALMRLHELTGKPIYLAQARELADFLLEELRDPRSGGFFASTIDPAAVGVFAERRVPAEDHVAAVRFLARLAKVEPSERLTSAIAAGLRAATRPEVIKARGRFLGDLLLALEETRGVRGAGVAPVARVGAAGTADRAAP